MPANADYIALYRPLARHSSLIFRAFLDRLDTAKLEELSENVLEVASLDELMDWIRNAAEN
jgi:hypothetical protein